MLNEKKESRSRLNSGKMNENIELHWENVKILEINLVISLKLVFHRKINSIYYRIAFDIIKVEANAIMEMQYTGSKKNSHPKNFSH